MRGFNLVGAVVAGLASLAMSPVAAWGQQPEKCFLWTVTSKSATVHLFGTLHQGHPGLYPLPKEVEDAFAGSRTLAVEFIAGTHRRKLDELLQKHRDYPDGESLSRSVSKATMDHLHRFHEKREFDIAAYERMRPWKAWVDLSGLNAKPKEAWDAQHGVDKHLLNRAERDKKAMVELESVDDALWFTTLSAELQETLLRVMLSDRNADIDFPIDELGAAWQAGDTAAVERIIIGDPVKRHPAYKGVLEKMLDERNAKMAEKIESYLIGTDTVFVAVGSGHLIGPKGIVRLLEGKGHRVTQMVRVSAKK